MLLKQSIVIFPLILAISRINAENVNDETEPWNSYKILGITYPSHKVPKPIPPPLYIGIWQHPIKISSIPYEDGDLSQDVSTTASLLAPDPPPATPIYTPMGPSFRPTLPPRLILRPTSSNAGTVVIKNLQKQRPYPDNQGFSRPILYSTTTAPIQFQTSELPSNSYQRGLSMSVRPMFPIRPVPRPIPQPINTTYTTPNPIIQRITEPIPSSEIKESIASDTVVTPSQTEIPIFSRPRYLLRPIPRPVPQPTPVNTLFPANPLSLEPISEQSTSNSEFLQPTVEEAVQPNNIPTSYPIQSKRPILPTRYVPRPISKLTGTEIKDSVTSATVFTPTKPETAIFSRPTNPIRPTPIPDVPQSILINTITPTNPTTLEQVLETTTSNPELIQAKEIEQPIYPSSYPIQSGRPMLPIRHIPRPIPQPTVINKTSMNPSQIEPESSDRAPKNEPAPSSEYSVSSVTESPVTNPSYPINFQRPILPSRPILLPIPIAAGQTAPTPEPFTAATPPQETEAHSISNEPIPQPLPDSLPTSNEGTILPVGRPTLPPRPNIGPPSNDVIIVPRTIPYASVKPKPLKPEPITTRPTFPSRPITTFPSYNPPRPILPSRPPSVATNYPNTKHIVGKTVADVDIVDDSELLVEQSSGSSAIIIQPSAPVANKEIVINPQQSFLPPTTSSPVLQPVHSYVPAPIDIEIMTDYRCPQMDGFFSIANECDTYVECKTSIAVKYSCPDGLHFNPNATWPEYACAYPSEVKCNSNANENAPRPTTLCPRQYGYFPSSDGDCSRFIQCQEGMAIVMNCPSGLAFNPDKSSCDWPANVPNCRPSVFQGFTCPVPSAAEDGSPSDIIYKFRFRNHCREYIACQHGHPRLLSCDPGLHFDEASKSCISSDYVSSCEM